MSTTMKKQPKPPRLMTLAEFEKQCGSRAEASRITQVPYVTLCRWEAGKVKPSRVYRDKFREQWGVELVPSTAPQPPVA